MVRLTDTNILLYAVSDIPSESAKRARAAEILGDRGNVALSVQVLAEFYHQATRPSRPNRLNHDEAMMFIDRLAAIPLQPVTDEVFRLGAELCHRYGISYWDAAIIAAAATLSCDAVYSEDLNDQQDYGGVRVINPFKEIPAA